jgi:aryl-alcohol dehydrogenase-like predicted oxidoreductase
MTFGEDWGFGSPVSEAEAIMGRYFERGGNFVDTANGYTGGHSERIIGNFIAHDRARRDEIVIATKFFSNLSPVHRLHRPLLDARVGSLHAHRGDDAGTRRSGPVRQSPLHRLL